VVRGRVQGVGFRASVAETARALGLCGWVRNRPDGTVEVDAAGEEETLLAFERFLRRGPRMAHVSGVDSFWNDGTTGSSSFEIR